MNKLNQFIYILVVLNAVLLPSIYSKTKQEWAKRSVYQVITDRFAQTNNSEPYCDIPKNTYCGGSFKGIQNQLDYIQGMGFDSIWISPIPKNYPNAYYGYAAMDIYQINEHFGSEQDFQDLLEDMRSRDMWLMLDIVANHMGNTNTDFSQNVPFNQQSDYHDYCSITDDCFAFHNMDCIIKCRLAGLADLDQSNPRVEKILIDWIVDLAAKFEVEGLRIDTVPEVSVDFWSKFNNAIPDVFTIGEVFDGDMGYARNYIGPLDSVLNYPYYFQMRDLWISGNSMYKVRQYYEDWRAQISVEQLGYLGLFTDNHDNPRFLSDQVCMEGWRGNYQEKCVSLYESFIVMTLTSVGIPIIYYGSEQYFDGRQDPYNREPMWSSFNESSSLYDTIRRVNKFRADFQPYDHSQVESYVNDDVYCFFRGNTWVGVTNKVSQYDDIKILVSYNPFSAGMQICNILKDNDCQIVDNGGNFHASFQNGQSLIYVPKDAQQQILE